MSVSIDQDIYKWLLGLDVLKMTACQRQLPNGKIELDPALTSHFSTGLIFARLITRIVKNFTKAGKMTHINLASLDAMKANTTSASLTYNWNLIADILKQLNLNVDKDIKDLIIGGDSDMIQELLREIHDHYHPKAAAKSRQSINRANSVGSDLGTLEESPVKSGYQDAVSPISPMKAKKFETDVIDIEKVKADKDLDNTTTVLEFFLVSLSKHLSLEPKQALTLLTNNFKFLAHILAKGLRGQFEPIALWYLDISSHVEHLVTLIEKDKENNVELVQQACRPGLLSKNAEAVECACEFFTKLAYEFTDRDLTPLAWDWFIRENGGMQGCLFGLKRHPHLADSIISVLIQYSRLELLDLFTIHLRSVFPDIRDQITTMMVLFNPLNESEVTKEELLTSGVVDAWIEMATKYLENDSLIDAETRQAALTLLCDIWLIHRQHIEQHDYVPAGIINSLKKAARDRSKPVAMGTVCLMFRLLEHFAAEKNTYAAIIYKTLTFSVIENHQTTAMKEFLIRNFKILFEQNPTVPIAILLEPLLKHMQANESTSSTMNIFEIEFFYSIIRHPKFNESNALQLFYVMADVYLNNLPLSKDSLMIIFELLRKYFDSEPLQEAVTKFIKASLAMFFSSEKNKRPKPKPATYHHGSPTKAQNAELESEYLKAQKRAMIIHILKTILGFRNTTVNERAKTFILYTHSQLKTQLNTEHKGILALLSFYGDPEELTREFETEAPSPKGIELPQVDYSGKRSPTRKDLDMEERTPVSKAIELEGSGVLKRSVSVHKARPVQQQQQQHQQSMKLGSPDSSSKKLPKTSPKIEEELGRIQREFQRKQIQQVADENEEKEKLEQQKKKLKVQLDKRKIELGVAPRNQKNVETNIIFAEGSRDLEKLLEKKHGLSEIELINFDEEEERDKEAVHIFLKKYSKILHYLFVSYANVGFTSQDHNSFAKLADKLSVMNLNDIWKVLSDHDCTKFTHQEEVHTLVRLINTKVLSRSEIKTLPYQGFKEFFVQFAVLVFSRPPKDLSYMPIFVSVEALLHVFKEATQKRGKSTTLYDDPYASDVGDKDLQIFLNNELQKDPEYPLPEAYKKVIEKNATFRYQLPETIQIPKNFLMCYHIVEDIINTALGIRLVEPVVNFTSVPKAKLKVFDSVKIDYTPDHHLKPTHGHKKAKAPAPDTTVKRRVLNIEDKPKLSLELKKGVAGFPYKDRSTAQDVAEVLELLLRTVEEGRNTLEPKEKPSFKTKQKEEKEKEKEEQQKLEVAVEQKRQKRAEEVKALAKDLKAKKEEAEKAKALLESPEKKKEEARTKYVNELKEKAKEIREKKDEDKKKKQEEEEQKKKAEEEERKGKFKTFNTQNVERLTKIMQENKDKKEDEEKKKKEKEELEKKKKEERNKQIKELAEKSKEIREKHKEITNRIRTMIKESDMKKLLDQYDKRLQAVFRFYIDNLHLSLSVGHSIDVLPFQAFAAFGADFNIFPGIIPVSELKLLYNTIAVAKKTEQDTPMGITYDEFIESLLRIAIKGREKLDKIYNIKRQLNEAKEKETVKAAEEELKREIEDQGDGNAETEGNERNAAQDDKYEEIEGTTQNTLEGLLYYLDLPKDKAILAKKLISLKESRPKTWKERVNYWKKDLIVDNLQEMVIQKLPGLGQITSPTQGETE